MQVEFARARAVAAAAGGADAALEARVLGVAAGAFDLEDDVELSNPNSAAGLRWRTRLGLHAWYGRGDNFEDALGAFDEAVCDGRARAPLADEVGGRVPAAHYTLLKLAFSSDFEDADALLTSFAHGLRCGEAPGGRWHAAQLRSRDFLWRGNWLWRGDFLWRGAWLWRGDWLWRGNGGCHGLWRRSWRQRWLSRWRRGSRLGKLFQGVKLLPSGEMIGPDEGFEGHVAMKP